MLLSQELRKISTFCFKENFEGIYEQLNTHNFDFLRLNAKQINEHLSVKKQEDVIENLLLLF